MNEAVLLVSHGTVDDLDDLGAFVANVRRGHAPSPELVAELRRRYEAIGGKSPLNVISGALASKLEARLGVRVAWANRLWRPYVRDVLARLAADGVARVALVPLAQHSARVYADDARRAAEGTGMALECSGNWGRRDAICRAFASRISSTLGPAEASEGTVLLMTAHSLPRAVVDRGDPYEREVRASAQAIAAIVHERQGRPIPFTVAFQSQGLSGGGEWLGPNLREALDDAKSRGFRRAVVAPVGFLADHVEVLYDIDVEARAYAAERGLLLDRTPSLNADDDFVDALAEVSRPLLDHG